MKIRLSDRVSRIKPSATLAITAKAKQLRAEGKDVIGFGAGEPDFDTPEQIKKAAIEAINAGQTKYTPVGGTVEIKTALAARIQADYGLVYLPGELLVSAGGKHSLYNICQALFQEGDEVIIPAPYWVSYPELVEITGATPVVIETNDKQGFAVSPEQLEKAITKKTRAFILNSPSNPTGAMYSEKQIRALAEVLEKHPDVWIISDDIYQKLVYEGEFFSIATIGEAWRHRTLVVNGASKAYSMTGWRIGTCAGPVEVIKAMEDLQSQSTSNPCSISQAAATEAFRMDQSIVSEMLKAFDERRNWIVEALNAIPGISCYKPQGAFYVFPNVNDLLGKKAGSRVIETDLDLAGYLLDEAQVAVVPGTPFGAPGYMRLSYATGMDAIKKGVGRIEEAVKKLQ